MKGFHEKLQGIARKLFPEFFGPEDPGRRRFMATTAKAGLYPVLNSVVPEVLTSSQYTDESLKTAESLYSLGREIKFLKQNETILLFRDLRTAASEGHEVLEVVEKLRKNRTAIEAATSKFDEISKKAIADTRLHGWEKTFFKNESESIIITPDGVTIKSYDFNIRKLTFNEDGFMAYPEKIQPMNAYIGTREGLFEVVESLQKENKILRELDAAITTPKISNYELASHLPNKGLMEEFGFEQDRKSWRAHLREQAESPYANRYR